MAIKAHLTDLGHRKVEMAACAAACWAADFKHEICVYIDRNTALTTTNQIIEPSLSCGNTVLECRDIEA